MLSGDSEILPKVPVPKEKEDDGWSLSTSSEETDNKLSDLKRHPSLDSVGAPI